MIRFNLQLLGGRGSSAKGGRGANSSGGAASSSESKGGGGGGTFSSESDFENSLTGFDDPRLKEYSSALSDSSQRVSEINSLKTVASNEGLSDWTKKALTGEKNQAEKELKNLPKEKTPSQLGKENGLKQTISAIDNILSIKPSGKKTQSDVSILA